MQRSVPANPALVNAARQARGNCETRAALNTPPEKHVHQFSPWRRAALWPLAALVRLWSMTIRAEVPEQDLEVLCRDEPILFVLWHNRLFIMAEMTRRYRGGRPMYGLVSASRDGAWLAAFFSACGMRAVRGSSSRLGHEGAKAMVEVLRAGSDAGMTPDGPRGPAYEMKAGALVVARRAQRTVVLLGVDYESSWRLPSWDGFYLPRPFSKMHLRAVVVQVDAHGDRDEAARGMGTILSEINPDRRAAPVRRRDPP
jgi:lysophospholipid acyltransferase (LPLAT)-like uncharacterized protein